MVDKILLDKLKSMRKNPDSTGYDAFIILFHIFKQLTEENEELKKKIEGLDLCLQYIIVEDGEELYKYWSSIRDNKVEFDEGDGPRVTVTLKGSRDIFGGILDRQFDYIDAVKAGDLEITGKINDVIAYAEILILAGEILDNLLG